jgi:hypothetical protein
MDDAMTSTTFTLDGHRIAVVVEPLDGDLSETRP